MKYLFGIPLLICAAVIGSAVDFAPDPSTRQHLMITVAIFAVGGLNILSRGAK